MYFRKVTKNFGQSAFLSAREIEHGQFRALFADTFWSKMQNGQTSPKNKKRSVQQSALSMQPNQDPLTTKDRKDTKEDEGLQPVITETHANLGCGGLTWDPQGGGGRSRSGDPVIGESGDRKSKSLLRIKRMNADLG